MNIGYFSSKFPYFGYLDGYSYGGSVMATFYLASEIAKLGHNVKIFTTSADIADKIEEQNGLTIFRFGTEMRFMTSNLSLGLFYKPLNHSMDIAHVSFDMPPAPFSGLLYCMKKKIPLITTYHGDWDDKYGSFLRRVGVSLNNLFVEKLLSYSKIIISPSRTYANSSPFLRKYKEKVVIIPNGVDFNAYNLPTKKEAIRKQLNLPLEKFIILFLGNLSPYKGPDILLNAMPTILKKYDVMLIIAGKGIMYECLQEISKDLNLKKHVQFIGHVSDAQKILLFNAVDIFCLPSTMVTECYPLTILEAMASGVPVVASKIGGIPDIIQDGHNGILVSPNNSKLLSNAILSLLDNASLRDAIGKSGKVFAKTQSWASQALKTEKIYEKLIN
ncbi:MAG: glycosyltransferase family 4 protein [Candidatus Methanosuratincola petrocarbonis]